MSEELKPCPFCGGKAKISYIQESFLGWNGYGDKKIKYRVHIICNKCHAKGKPIITDWLVNPKPWSSVYRSTYDPKWGSYGQDSNQTEMFRPYVEQAIEAWNRRTV